MNKKTIKKIKWIKYLERKQSIFLFTIFLKLYGLKFKKETGFGFTKQLRYFKGKKGTYYMTRKEMDESDVYFSNILKENEEEIIHYLQKEKETHELIKTLNSNKSIKKQISICQEIILYNTVIPYRFLAAIESYPETKASIKPELLEQLIKCREKSLYPALEKKFFPKIFKLINLKISVPQRLASMLTHLEVIKVFENNYTVSVEELEKRKKGTYLMENKNEEFDFFYSKNDFLEEKHAGIKEVKGQIGYKGKLKGKARIVNSIKDSQKFEKGDILISINTNPSLVSIIQKAGAIVSDEGGITCHAAIIAREMKKPCVIGTRFATKIFKDGDLVEVDADKGVVRRVY